MNKLFVRIGPKTGPEKFFRCGMHFVRAWTVVEVDDATAARLHAEQMLEVTDKQPADYSAPATDDAGAEAEAAAAEAEAEAEAAKAQAGAAEAEAEAEAAKAQAGAGAGAGAGGKPDAKKK